MSSQEIPAFLARYLTDAMTWAEGAPEHGQKQGVHLYLTNVDVVCEGEVIGQLHNEEPEWVYRPLKEQP